MIWFLLAAAGILAWYLFTQIRYLIKGSPEKQREEAAYRQLMDQYIEEASYYMGRPVSEEEILRAGREYRRDRKRFSKRHYKGPDKLI